MKTFFRPFNEVGLTLFYDNRPIMSKITIAKLFAAVRAFEEWGLPSSGHAVVFSPFVGGDHSRATFCCDKVAAFSNMRNL